jgi:hypothetical protein
MEIHEGLPFGFFRCRPLADFSLPIRLQAVMAIDRGTQKKTTRKERIEIQISRREEFEQTSIYIQIQRVFLWEIHQPNPTI